LLLSYCKARTLLLCLANYCFRKKFPNSFFPDAAQQIQQSRLRAEQNSHVCQPGRKLCAALVSSHATRREIFNSTAEEKRQRNNGKARRQFAY
jgi:hypothetical protein